MRSRQQQSSFHSTDILNSHPSSPMLVLVYVHKTLTRNSELLILPTAAF